MFHTSSHIGRAMTLASIIGLSVLSSTAVAEARRIWENRPMPVLIPVSKEIRWVFPQDVTIQLPEAISAKVKVLAPDAKTLYLTATEKFETARVLATGVADGKVYILDVKASPTQGAEDFTLEDPELVATEKTSTAAEASASDTSHSDADADVPDEKPLLDPAEIVLTRFAMQTLYAPSRLIPSDDRIGRAPNGEIPRKFPLIQSSQGEWFNYQVVGTWSGFERYITAILIVNQSDVRSVLDLTKVRGNFSHISAQHHFVGPKGSMTDRTTLYLISEKPFNEALMEEAYAY
jgi:integrating conjugative element protein (TIGR03749 family)